MVAIAQEMKVTENRRDQEEMLQTSRLLSVRHHQRNRPRNVRIADDPVRFRLQLTFAWLSQTDGMIAK
jgi:hypothetical protein